MRKPKSARCKSQFTQSRWGTRDFIAAFTLFIASAAVVLWQNAHLAVLWDTSYILDTAFRISLGQTPYRDFPLAHAPLTFLVQAALIRIGGRVFFHHVLYAAVVGGLGTVLAWRIVLETLRGRVRAEWAVSLFLAGPLTVLGIYSILPFPFYDCDCVFCILVVIYLLQRMCANDVTASNTGSAYLRAFVAGVALPLPLFFKQNVGLPLLLAALAFFLLLLLAKRLRGNAASRGDSGVAELGWILAGATATLVAAVCLLHFTVGVRNYLHWTVQFASQRRLPGFQLMLGVYTEPSLLWWLPAAAVALVLLRARFARTLWARLAALGLLGAPFIWTLVGLFLSSDSDDRASSLLTLWPLLLVLSGVLALWNLRRGLSLRAVLPVLVLVTINGTLLSQQLWGSTYAIWPLLVLLIAEIVAFLASIESASAIHEATHWRQFVATGLAAIISATLVVCGGLYMASEERLSYAQLPDGPALHSTVSALRGMAVTGPFLPDFEELLRFAANKIPVSDGLILIPGEDPFYFATGRVPQFPVLLFDNATDPFSPTQLVEEAQRRNIRWLIVKRDLQLKEDPTPQREAALEALRQVFLPYRELGSYDVYRRP